VPEVQLAEVDGRLGALAFFEFGAGGKGRSAALWVGRSQC
jgi:hypothetical protein